MTQPALPTGVALVRAPNPGPMTLEGTNTWLLSSDAGAVVVDPGPADEGHLDRVRSAADALAGGVVLIVLTHGHLDHSAGAVSLATSVGAPVAAVDPALCRNTGALVEGAELPGGAQVLLTPGHTEDSACLLLPDAALPGVAPPGAALPGAVLTGDTILGRGTSVVMAPGGRLTAYLTTLERLRHLGPRTILPGHGPVRPDLAELAGALHAHRLARLAEVQAALAAGARTSEEVVDRVYPDLAPALRPAALRSTEAALNHLHGSSPR